jgi:glucose-6-phosphate 1-dehydrogenase
VRGGHPDAPVERHPAHQSAGSGPDSWLDAKSRVVSALRPLTLADGVRGQYDGYRDVDGVDPLSTVETYVAVRLALDSWRACRSSSAQARPCRSPQPRPRAARVSIRPVPFDVFGVGPARLANTLRFRIWADAEISLTPRREEARRGTRA